MTQQIDPVPPEFAVQSAVPRPAKRNLAWLWILGIVLAFGSGLAIGLVADAGQGGSPTSAGRGKQPLVGAATTSTTSTTAPTTSFEEPTTTTSAPEPPSAGDFAISIKVLSKHCFGSAGCNITYRIDPSYSGPPLDSSETYTITYEVTGVEDGPQINSFTLTGDQAQYDSEEMAQTTSANAKLKAKVTGVAEG